MFGIIIALLLTFLFQFVLMRSIIGMVISEKLNNSNKRKRKKNQKNFFDWIFYKVYKDAIPKKLLILYYVIVFKSLLLVLTHIILSLSDVSVIVYLPGFELEIGQFLIVIDVYITICIGGYHSYLVDLIERKSRLGK